MSKEQLIDGLAKLLGLILFGVVVAFLMDWVRSDCESMQCQVGQPHLNQSFECVCVPAVPQRVTSP